MLAPGAALDETLGNCLLHQQEKVAFGDAGYQGVDKRPDANTHVRRHVVMRPGLRRTLAPATNALDALTDKVEQAKASVRAKVGHLFRVIRRQFGHLRCAIGGARNTAQLKVLFALSNLRMARRAVVAKVRLAQT